RDMPREAAPGGAPPHAVAGYRQRAIPGRRAARSFEGLATVVTATIIVAALYFAQSVLVPLALAILLSFALGPLVVILRRRHFGRVPSVAIAVLVGFLVISSVGVVIGTQVTQLAEKLPLYQTNLIHKLTSAQGAILSNGIGSRVTKMFSDID